MKREGILFGFLILILTISILSTIDITDKTITGEVTSTTNITIDVTDTKKPTFIKNQTNETLAGNTANFSLFVNDETALQNNGQYIFSINQTGAWVNDSVVNFTTTGEWANVTKVLNSTVGAVIGYQWYLTDNIQNTNHTITHHGEAFRLTTTETSTPDDSGSGSGGGGGGGIIAPITTVKDFIIDKEEILISLEKGGTKKETTIIIRNIGNTLISLNLENSGLENFMEISETSFNLNPGESKGVILEFLASKETIPDLYVGKLLVNSNGLKKEVLISVLVETRDSLFDVELEIPYRFEYVLPGENVSAEITMFNLGEEEANVFIEYIIKDENGNQIVLEEENRTIKNQVKITKTLKIPEEAASGKYIFYVKGNYLEEVAIASEFFNVGKRPFLKQRILFYTLINIVALIILFAIIYKIRKKKKLKLSSLKKENLRKLRSIERRMNRRKEIYKK